MRMKTVTPEIKQYLIKVYTQYEEGKLSMPEQIQLFQDLWDSGLIFDMGPEAVHFAQRLIKVKLIQPKTPPEDNNAN